MMKNLLIKIIKILFEIIFWSIVFLGFNYKIVYQWFYVSQWETMNIIFKIILIAVFIILNYLYIKRRVTHILHIIRDEK